MVVQQRFQSVAEYLPVVQNIDGIGRGTPYENDPDRPIVFVEITVITHTQIIMYGSIGQFQIRPRIVQRIMMWNVNAFFALVLGHCGCG
jgi:hypothetical protein